MPKQCAIVGDRMPSGCDPAQRFLWGVATSAYQHEGGFNGAGQPLNNWAFGERTQRFETSGRAAGFWQRFGDDFALCRELGLNAFRLGISWSRVQPSYDLAPLASPPPFDYEALEHYAEIIAECRRHGLEPIVTLHHFTHPLWLGLDPWLEPKTIDYFLRYIHETVTYLLAVLPQRFQCAPPRFFVTINEPNMLASCTYFAGAFPSEAPRGPRSFTMCLGHLLEAHVRAYHLIHDLYAPTPVRPMVGFNNYCSDLYWNDQAWLDLLFARQERVARGRLLSHLWECAWAFDRSFREAQLPIEPWARRTTGEVIKKAHHFLAYGCSFDNFWDRLVDVIYQSRRAPLDYIGIDYYDPFAAHALRLPTLYDQLTMKHEWHERVLASVTNKWWDWRLLPEGLGFFVRSLRRFDLPILIAENGLALRSDPESHQQSRRDGQLRSDFIRRHVAMVGDLVAEGHPIIGYMYWSLTDNYEWGTYAARFGLYTIDFSSDLTRMPLGAQGDHAPAAYAEAIAKARARMSGGADAVSGAELAQALTPSPL